MAYTNFIPTVWAENINRELERLCVFAEDCNRQYEGKVEKEGDSVRILGVGKPTISKTTNKDLTLPDAETVEDTSITMPVRQIAYFNYLVDDIDKRQAKGGVMEALSQETSEGLSNEMDQYIAGMSLQGNAIKDAAAVQTLTKSNILGVIDNALEKLYENDVKQNTKITMTVPPWFYTIFKQAYIDLDTDNSEMMKNGRVGRYGSITVKMSNNVAKDSSGNSLIQVKTNRAIAFVNPMTHTEPYRPEKKFSDAVKGFILYDAKIVRPKEMINIFCKK